MKQKMLWSEQLKIAVIEQNVVQIGKLIKDVPQFTELSEAQEALALIQEAITLVNSEQSKMMATMKKIKQTKAFLDNQ